MSFKLFNGKKGRKPVITETTHSKHHYTKKEIRAIKARAKRIDETEKEVAERQAVSTIDITDLSASPSFITGESKKIYDEVISFYQKLGTKFLNALDLNDLDMYCTEVANYRYDKTRIPQLEKQLDDLLRNTECDMEPKERFKYSLETTKALTTLRTDQTNREKTIINLEEHLSLTPSARKKMEELYHQKKHEEKDEMSEFLSSDDNSDPNLKKFGGKA